MMEKRKLLIVYNTCGIQRDNTEWYIHCIESFLNQNFEDSRVVWSSCLNSSACFKEIYNTFGNKISYCYHVEPHTVNITFNKTVQECVKEFGEFEFYCYVDSGCTLGDTKDILSTAYSELKENNYGMLALQVDTDEALQAIDPKFKYQTSDVQIKDENFIIPLGKACNGHVFFHSNDFLENYNNKIWPDVFAAYCTESVFTFLCSAMKQHWAILKDIKIEHRKSIDGATMCAPHHSLVHNNHWNNLLYERNALDFIKDKNAFDIGLGYEECNNIMMHNSDAYDNDGLSLFPEELTKAINKYFFLNKEELDYDKIRCKFSG